MPLIDEVRASAFTIPTDRRESDGTLEWDATMMVVVEVAAGGRVGLGYSYADAGAAGLVARRFNARGIGAGKTAVMINAPTEAVFGPPRAVDVAIEPGALRVVYHGGLADRYGVDSLLRALTLVRRELPNATLDVYSQMATGPEAERLRESAPAGATIHRRPIEHAHVPAILEHADIGVVPTLSDEFTRLLLPVKLMEYVHMGLPVVASDLPIVREVFGPDAVALVPPGNPEAIAAALVDLARDPARAAVRARRAACRLEPLSWNAHIDRYTSLIDELVRRSHSRAADRRFRLSRAH